MSTGAVRCYGLYLGFRSWADGIERGTGFFMVTSLHSVAELR